MADFKPLSPHLPVEAPDLAQALRDLLNGMAGYTLRRYAARRNRDVGSVSRYFNGTRRPPWEFVIDLVTDLTEHRGAGAPTVETLEHLRKLHTAWEEKGTRASPDSGVEILTQQLAAADRLSRVSSAQSHALSEALADRQHRIADLEVRLQLVEADLARATAQAEEMLATWPAHPSASQRRRLAALFLLVALLIGLAGGIINGVLIARFNITPILCTLGTQMAFTGLAVVVSGGRAVMVGSPDLLSRIGNDMFLAVPISFLIFIAMAVLIAAVVRFTPYGYWLMLMGTNPKAAVFAGFPRNGVLVATYATSGLLAGLAGIIIAARNVNVKFDYGSSYLLVAILIAVMAGVKPEGGYGRVICVVLSAVALQLMSSLLNFGGLSNFVRDFAWGLLLLYPALRTPPRAWRETLWLAAAASI